MSVGEHVPPIHLQSVMTFDTVHVHTPIVVRHAEGNQVPPTVGRAVALVDQHEGVEAPWEASIVHGLEEDPFVCPWSVLPEGSP